jgi:hypothetical protein
MKDIELYRTQIVKLYTEEKLGIQKIAKIIHKSKPNIQAILKEEGILNSVGKSNIKYQFNHNYFDCIDTDNKAYFLGLMFADGNICINRGTYVVRLISKDKEILEQLLLDLNANSIIYRDYHKKYNKECFRIQLSSEIMFNSLNTLGCTPKKSLTLKFPNINQKFISHFIRGYFDGDGTVGVYSVKHSIWKRLMSGFCGTKEFLEVLVQYLPTKKKTVYSRNSNLSLLSFSVEDSILLYNYMYKNATVYLQRKYTIFNKEIKQRGSETTISNPSRKRIKV